MSTMETTAPPVDVPPMPLLQRVIGVFTSPRRVFESLRVHPAILGALILNMLCFAGSYIPLSPLIHQVQMEKTQEAIDKNENIPQEKKDEIIERQSQMMNGPMMKVVMPIITVVVVALMILFWSAMVQLGTNFLLGAQISFRQALSVSLHVGLILFLGGGLLKTPLAVASKNLYAATSLALLLPEANPKSMVWALLNTFDVFTIWSLIVLAIGLSAVTGLPTKKTRVVSFVLFGVLLVFAAVGALMAGLGG